VSVADVDALITFIGTFTPGGGTQWDEGMQGAANFFSFSNQDNPIIIFMSDGNPNDPGTVPDDAERQSITDDAVDIRNSIPDVELYFIQIDLESTTYSSQLDNTDGVDLISSSSGQLSSLIFGIIGLNSANPAEGICEIRVNGITEVSASGIETVATDNIGYSKLHLIFGGATDHGVTTDIDDFYIWDDSGAWNNSFLGDRRALLRAPDADTNISDFDPISGDLGYLMVDEDSPDGDSTYVFADSALLPGSPLLGSSEFEIQNLPNGVSHIAGLSVFTRAKKTDSSDAEIFIFSSVGRRDSEKLRPEVIVAK
jgi:hypothetical protein